MTFASEVNLGKRVVRWLELGGVDVYQEVETGRGRADIVGIDGPHVMVIELKLSWSLDLLEQAASWYGWAHDVWIAVPGARAQSKRAFSARLAGLLGIGVLEVWPSEHYSPGIDGVHPVVEPRFNRRAQADMFRKGCRPEHKRFAPAGSAQGGHFTPYKGTCAAVLAYVEKHPGCTLKEMVEAVPTHYGSKATARARMAMLIDRDAVPGVACVRSGRELHLFTPGALEKAKALKASAPSALPRTARAGTGDAQPSASRPALAQAARLRR